MRYNILAVLMSRVPDWQVVIVATPRLSLQAYAPYSDI
jgi:hypothetical protein